MNKFEENEDTATHHDVSTVEKETGCEAFKTVQEGHAAGYVHSKAQGLG